MSIYFYTKFVRFKMRNKRHFCDIVSDVKNIIYCFFYYMKIKVYATTDWSSPVVAQ